MISPRVSWLIPAALMLAYTHHQASASPKATPEQIESQTVVDESGRPVKAGELALPNYSKLPHGIKSREFLSSDEILKGAAVSANPTAPSGQHAFASFASLGECLGCTGLPLFNHNGRMEFFASTTGLQLPSSTYPGTPNDFWYALTYNATTSSFNQVFVSERLPGGIAQLLLLPAACSLCCARSQQPSYQPVSSVRSTLCVCRERQVQRSPPTKGSPHPSACSPPKAMSSS